VLCVRFSANLSKVASSIPAAGAGRARTASVGQKRVRLKSRWGLPLPLKGRRQEVVST
jgi:hypothetical protein